MASSSLSPDKILITDLSLALTISLDHWSRSLPSPHVLSLTITHPIETSASTDTLPSTINYSTATKAVTAHVQSRSWASLEECAEAVVVVLQGLGAGRVGVKIGATKVLAGGWVEVQIWRGGQPEQGEKDVVRIREIPVRCVIGINPQERLEKQMVVVDLEAPLPPFAPSSSSVDSSSTSTGFPHKLLSDAVHDFVTPTSYQTIESITSNLATHLLSLPLPTTYPHSSLSYLTVRVSKPYALTFAKYASVEITRSSSSPSASSSLALGASSTSSSNEHVAILALGSNIGDSVANITKAVEMINTESEGTSRLVETSFLYQSEPMYVEDQAKFVNGACKITTTLSPLLLLRLLKKIESAVGRTKTFTNGPRVVDLDLIFYDDESVELESEEGGLIVPHPRLAEREFVLRPLADIIPTYQHPFLPSPISTLLSLLPPSLIPILPFHSPSTPLPTTPSLLIMSILNLTPDSFSDGASYPTTASLIQAAQKMINQGANILDVGGLSTRPGADEVSEEEETRRVVEGIKALREAGIQISISVDTYRAGVAREALKVGASCVNDVRAGAEKGMLEVMAKASVPVVLMHSRGTSKTMGFLTDYSSSVLDDASGGSSSSIVEAVRLSLLASVKEALKAGVKKWNIILDPGLGFAKTSDQNLELLAHLEELTREGSGLEGYPVLVGGSRKRFVGEVTGVEVPRERVGGSLGVVAACYVGGEGRRVTKVVRVHDTKETRELIGVLEAVGRGRV